MLKKKKKIGGSALSIRPALEGKKHGAIRKKPSGIMRKTLKKLAKRREMVPARPADPALKAHTRCLAEKRPRVSLHPIRNFDRRSR